VEAKQLAGSGEWIVSSASRPGIAYRTDGVSCDCEAAMLGGDQACLHRAAYWYAQGVLELDPEPEPPASAAAVACFACNGCGRQWYRGGYALLCATCGGTGIAPLDDGAATDDALQAVCGTFIEADRAASLAAMQAAIAEAYTQLVAESAALAA
jgi:hypothetical protein